MALIRMKLGSSVGRAAACQCKCCGFKPQLGQNCFLNLYEDDSD